MIGCLEALGISDWLLQTPHAHTNETQSLGGEFSESTVSPRVNCGCFVSWIAVLSAGQSPMPAEKMYRFANSGLPENLTVQVYSVIVGI